MRTPWMAARLLSKEPELAQAAAKDLARHLASTNAANTTSFEHLLFSTEDLWNTLVDFCNTNPAVILWHGNGMFQTLFKVLGS